MHQPYCTEYCPPLLTNKFWAKAALYAAYTCNRFPCGPDCIIPKDLWQKGRNICMSNSIKTGKDSVRTLASLWPCRIPHKICKGFQAGCQLPGSFCPSIDDTMIYKCISIKTGWPLACCLAKETTCENFKMISFARLVFLMFAHFLINGQ